MDQAIKWVWQTTWAKELLMLIATTVATIVAFELGSLADLIETNASAEELAGWARALGVSLLVTVLRQLVAWATARLAGTRL